MVLHQRNMGADFCYAYVIIEVDRETALQRAKHLTIDKFNANDIFIENAIENNTEHDWDNCNDCPSDVYSQEGLEHLAPDILPGIVEQVTRYINLTYDLWEGNTLSRVVSRLTIRGIEALMTGDSTWGDSWEELDAFGTLGALGITEFDY